MAKKRAKKTAVSSKAAKQKANEVGLNEKEAQTENNNVGFRDPEVERHIAATRAICDMEIEHLLTGVRLLRSYMNKEQLQTPVLQFFEENLPSVSVEHGRDGQVDMKWKDQEGTVSLNNLKKDLHVSLLCRLSMSYPHFPGAWQPFGAGNAMLDGTGAPSVGNHASFLYFSRLLLAVLKAMEDPYQSLALGLQTPGANSHRLSIGMTPKSQRHPKQGEMLLSVHGSPLGVYKEENNMDAIVESKEG